jgi:multidrug efflux pump subunit AcrB
MWIVRLALRRPYTFVVLSLMLFLLAPVVISRTPVDIFPDIDIPVVSIIWQYTGLSAEEMSERIVYVSERTLTTAVNNIEHIESQSMDGIAVVKLFLQPRANLYAAIAQAAATSQTLLKSLPPGATPPLVVSYNASTVPIVQLALSGRGLSEQQLFDIGQNFIRTQLVTVPGTAIPYSYGGKQRDVMVDLNPQALMAKGLSPTDVVTAINNQNLILPGGTSKIGSLEYDVQINAVRRK